MSLTTEDLTAVRDVVLEALDIAVNPRLDRIEYRLDSLEQKVDNLEQRVIRLEVQQAETNRRLDIMDRQLEIMAGKIAAIENDIKDIYYMLEQKPPSLFSHKKYTKLPDKEKLLVLKQELQILTQKMNIRSEPSGSSES